MRWPALLFVGFAWGCASQALAQSGANVTIQLPSFSSFGVNTTVLVPDSGPSPLAAYRQSAYSRATYGPWNPQRAFGAQRSAAIASVTAQVHDQRQADDAILRAARARRTNWARGSVGTRAEALAPPAAGTLQSVADIERGRQMQAAADNREALVLAEKGRQAEANGKPGVAAIYFGMAAKAANGPLKQDIENLARQLKAKPPSKSVGAGLPKR